jgi:hypothetical protein
MSYQNTRVYLADARNLFGRIIGAHKVLVHFFTGNSNFPSDNRLLDCAYPLVGTPRRSFLAHGHLIPKKAISGRGRVGVSPTYRTVTEFGLADRRRPKVPFERFIGRAGAAARINDSSRLRIKIVRWPEGIHFA